MTRVNLIISCLFFMRFIFGHINISVVHILNLLFAKQLLLLSQLDFDR